jgi:hypothetical protein
MSSLVKRRVLKIAALGALALGLSACVSDRGYGYSGVSLGYGSGYYGPAGYGGWYDDYYYPGGGYYVYDRAGTRHRWNDRQRAYWENRRGDDRRAEWRDNRRGEWRNRGDNNWRGDRDRDRDRWRGDRGLSRADRKSVREFGATIDQRRQAAAEWEADAMRRGNRPRR